MRGGCVVAKAEKKQPWFKFYPSDWSGDRKLHMCSIGARGLWIEMLCVMHEADPYGHLMTDGKAVTSRQIASLAGIPLAECGKYLAELESAGVYSRTETKVIYSRRMVRDKAKAEQDRKNGKGGGNPIITGEDNGGVNPPDNGVDKAQRLKPHSKNQNPETAAAAADLDEVGLKQESALKALFAATRSSLGWSTPNLDPIRSWLLDGIPQGTISAAVTPILKRKEDMASLTYCDGAVRQAHALSPMLQVVSTKVVVIEGTLEFTCWNQYLRETGQRPLFVCRQLSANDVIVMGSLCDSLFPPGYDEATGERIVPSGDEAAA
jgi:hypothetical protein